MTAPAAEEKKIAIARVSIGKISDTVGYAALAPAANGYATRMGDGVHDPHDTGDDAPEAPSQTAGEQCPECGGTGRLDGNECPACEGTGNVMRGLGGG